MRARLRCGRRSDAERVNGPGAAGWWAMTRGLGVAAALAAATLAGCGLGAGTAPGGVQLSVTDGFGSHALVSSTHPAVAGEETVMRLLTRNTRVTARYGG